MFGKFIVILASIVVFVNTAKIPRPDNEVDYGMRHGHGPPQNASYKAKIADDGEGGAQWGSWTPKVDHFNEEDDTTWTQRYTYNLDLAQENGPILIYVGGEWTIDTETLENGQIYDIAEQTGAALFYLEHRFYGQSMPKADFSLESLRYLTSQQATEDLLGFIAWLKEDDKYANSKVGLVGCSYSAALITWIKHMHPDSADAVWASSGPVLAKDNFWEYDEVVGRVIRDANEECYNVIRNGIRQLEESYDQDGGVAVRTMLRGCRTDPTDNILDKQKLFDTLSNSLGGLVQYSEPGDVSSRCDLMLTDQSESDNQTFANDFNRDLGANECQGLYYDVSLNSYSGDDNSERAWFFQTCNEFGYFMTSAGNDTNPFGSSFSDARYNHQLCQDVFGEDFTAENIIASIDTTNENYGGLTPTITNVISVHGGNDPWHTLGLEASTSETAPVFVVTGTSHCADQGGYNLLDPPEMMNAKQAVREFMSQRLA